MRPQPHHSQCCLGGAPHPPMFLAHAASRTYQWPLTLVLGRHYILPWMVSARLFRSISNDGNPVPHGHSAALLFALTPPSSGDTTLSYIQNHYRACGRITPSSRGSACGGELDYGRCMPPGRRLHRPLPLPSSFRVDPCCGGSFDFHTYIPKRAVIAVHKGICFCSACLKPCPFHADSWHQLSPTFSSFPRFARCASPGCPSHRLLVIFESPRSGALLVPAAASI